MPFGTEELEWWATRWLKNFDDMCNRLDTIPACDGQKNGRTEGCHTA